jgi:hypothetical protein
MGETSPSTNSTPYRQPTSTKAEQERVMDATDGEEPLKMRKARDVDEAEFARRGARAARASGVRPESEFQKFLPLGYQYANGLPCPVGCNVVNCSGRCCHQFTCD